MKTQIAVSLSLSLLLMAKMSSAECVEYQIIDHGDRVEAVCVGKPSTEAEKKELDKQNEQIRKKNLRDRILECFSSVKNYTDKQGKSQQEEVCKKMTGGYDINVYLAIQAASPVDGTNTPIRNTNSAGLAAMQSQIDAQQAQQQIEMQRQQAEMQRMQQQQNFNNIWNK
jgi:hypothetical protein